MSTYMLMMVKLHPLGSSPVDFPVWLAGHCGMQDARSVVGKTPAFDARGSGGLAQMRGSATSDLIPS